MGVIRRFGRSGIISVHLLKFPVDSQASVFLFVFAGLQCAVIRAEPLFFAIVS